MFIKTITKADAIKSLNSSAEFSSRGDSIEWINTTPIGEAEIVSEVERLQAEYDNKEYQRQRAAAYPSIADQLDTIYHSGIDAWKLTITAVKEEFPK
jgi:hypothetical protein